MNRKGCAAAALRRLIYFCLKEKRINSHRIRSSRSAHGAVCEQRGSSITRLKETKTTTLEEENRAPGLRVRRGLRLPPHACSAGVPKTACLPRASPSPLSMQTQYAFSFKASNYMLHDVSCVRPFRCECRGHHFDLEFGDVREGALFFRRRRGGGEFLLAAKCSSRKEK